MKKIVHIILCAVPVIFAGTRLDAATFKSRVAGNWSSSSSWVKCLTGNMILTNNSTNVTGTGTLFLSELQVGDIMVMQATPSTEDGVVASIQSNAQLTLVSPASNNRNAPYGIEAVPSLSDDVIMGKVAVN